jgi:hypothetical protein
MRGTGDTPVTAVVTAAALAGSEMVKVVVVDSRSGTNVSTSPALAGKGKADSPTETAGRQKFLYDRRGRARRFCLTGSRT